MLESIIICKHGNLGYTASLRFKDKSYDKDISANNKYSLYKTIEYIVRGVDESNRQHKQRDV